MDRRKVYEDALKTFGAESQIKMLFEEMGELMQAVCKESRAKNGEQRGEVLCNIAEEISDVKIMLAQMELLFDIDDIVEGFVELKTIQLATRLEAAHAGQDASKEVFSQFVSEEPRS